jgi:hypothetical protein
VNRSGGCSVSHQVTVDRRGWFASGWVFLSTGAFAALLFVACGTGTSHSASPPSSTSGAVTTTSLPDVAPTAADFVNINTMARVGDHFVGSLNGHLAAVLAVARKPKGGVYPVGTVIQLIPTEAMVKRHKGYSAATGDWQFFALKVSPQGTQIGSSGARVKNFFGGECASCHRAAASHFDFVCEKNHGCAPLGISDAFIARVQAGDPRPKH